MTHALVRLARNAHGHQLALAIPPREIGGIALVVLTVHAGALRNQRRRHHLARVAPIAQRAMEHVPGSGIGGYDLRSREKARSR